MLHPTITPFVSRSATPGKRAPGLELTGKTIVALMRANGHTIRGLAEQMGITVARVRHVRECGVQGMAYVWDWIEALQEAPRP